MTDSKDYSKTFQERLTYTRNLRKMTQQELGLKSNMNSSHIAHFESGSRKPSFDSICKLADGLSVSVDYLIGRTNKPESFYTTFRLEDYIKSFLESNSLTELKTKFISIMKKANNEQDKVLVIVEGGVVSDILKEGDVEVSVFDYDNFKEGGDYLIPKGFEKLIPNWIKDELRQRLKEIIKDIPIND